MTDKEYIKSLRTPSIDNPLRILISACMVGTICGFDGNSYEGYPSILELRKHKNIKFVPFCPEHFAVGTPREMSDCHGGTGMDVLDGKAKVITESGIDWSEKMILGANKMLSTAQENNIELAIMMDVSAACGSQVIYEGNRLGDNPTHQMGMGVAAALLHRNGFKIISQRDFYSMELLYNKLDATHQINEEAKDHDQHPWVLEYFGGNE